MINQTQPRSFKTPASTNRWIDDLIRQNKSVSVNVMLTDQGYVLTPVIEKPKSPILKRLFSGRKKAAQRSGLFNA
ncbi:MAG: hypothetical protein KBC57_00285 [Neisseriaceae bacterium]|nr:hypothetical protein [Neisseriaceae bacterium]